MDIEELKKLLAQLSDDDLEEIGLKKSTDSGAAVSSTEKLRSLREESIATRDLTDALKAHAAAIGKAIQNQKELGKTESIIKSMFGIESAQDAQDLVDAFDQSSKAFDGIGNSIAGLVGATKDNKLASTFDSIGKKSVQFARALTLMKGKDKTIALIGMSAAVTEQALQGVFTAVTSLAMGILNMSKTVILAFDQAQAKINATTGTIYQFNDVLYDAQRETNAFGITFDETANSLASLNRGLSTFISENETTQKELLHTVAGLSKFGISAEDSTKMLSFFTTNLGMLPSEAAEATKQLAFLSTAIGIDPAKMTSDFLKASASLAVYGDRTVKVFSNIAAAAKAAEVETSSLLGLAEKFDTFSGAAETTGKLNAILGSQLSALEMLTQTEDQRIETLIRSVQAQGVAFGQMDRFTQKAIAAAAGISDMNEAQRIFGMNINQYRNFANQQQESADIQQQFNDALKSAMPLVDKFRILFTEFVLALKPVFGVINSIMDSILDYVKNMNTDTKELIATIGFFGSIFIAAGISIITATIAIISSIATVSSAFTTAAGAAGAAAGGLGLFAGSTVPAATGLGVLTPELFATTGGLAGITAVSGPASAGLTGVGAAGNAAGASISAGMAKAAVGIGIAVLALVALAAAVAMVVSSFAALAEAEARQDEAKARQIEGFSKLSQSISQVEQSLVNIANIDLTAGLAQIIELAETLKNFDDVSIETKHTLTNLALITTGTAAEVMTASAAGQTFNIDNVVQNAISLEGIKVNVKVGEQEFADAVMKVVRDNQ